MFGLHEKHLREQRVAWTLVRSFEGDPAALPVFPWHGDRLDVPDGGREMALDFY